MVNDGKLVLNDDTISALGINCTTNCLGSVEDELVVVKVFEVAGTVVVIESSPKLRFMGVLWRNQSPCTWCINVFFRTWQGGH